VHFLAENHRDAGDAYVNTGRREVKVAEEMHGIGVTEATSTGAAGRPRMPWGGSGAAAPERLGNLRPLTDT